MMIEVNISVHIHATIWSGIYRENDLIAVLYGGQMNE